MFRFEEHEDLLDIWEASPWMFYGKIVFLKQCGENFHPSKDVIDRVPIWSIMSGFLVEYWKKGILLSIASKPSKCL